MAHKGNVTDNQHSSGGELSVKSYFGCLEEEEIHLEGIIAGYCCIENLYFNRELPQDVEVRWRRNGTPPTIFRCASERVEMGIWKTMPHKSTILNHSAKKCGQN